jgi:hypothetical protein
MKGNRVKRAVLVIALAATPLFADEIQLRGGGRLTGSIVEETSDNVTIDIGSGKMTVPSSSVVKIDRSTSPLQEYRARASKLKESDTDSWRQLGRWASGKGLSAQAEEAFRHVRKAHPDDAEANRALGLVQHQGQWVTEADSYKARGFIQFEGEWMTPAESQTIVAERHAREEANRQAVAAEVKASEESMKAREAEETRREEEERRRNELPKLGSDWNWGYAPSSWPAPGGNQ